METAEDFEIPWHTTLGMPTNASTGNKYNGINIILLWCRTKEQGHASSTWATYKQWQSLGAQVTKGQKGSQIIIYKPMKQEDNQPLSDKEHNRPRVFIGSATVFNASQVEGYVVTDDKLKPEADNTERLESVEQFILSAQADIRLGGDRAFYAPMEDYIAMPGRELFTGTSTISATEAYYSTLFHEMTHWSGSEKRCGRDMSGRFGGQSYAMEELVAEIGAAYLCANKGVSSTPRLDHANYLKNWLKVIKKDEKAIFWAATRAQEAVTYLNSLETESNI
tara:strand:- start:442 stop:1278 length:837 start_codon:yes stop_codon:yes gene_type:complete